MSVKFFHDSTHYSINLDPDSRSGLWRQNAMTSYDFIRPYMIVAKSLGFDTQVSQTPLFFLVYCHDHGWVQVPTDVGYTILDHPMVSPSRHSKIVVGSVIGATLLGISAFFRWKKKK